MNIKTAEQKEIWDTLIKLLELNKEDEDIIVKYLQKQGIVKLLGEYYSLPVSVTAKEKIRALSCILSYEEAHIWKR